MPDAVLFEVHIVHFPDLLVLQWAFQASSGVIQHQKLSVSALDTPKLTAELSIMTTARYYIQPDRPYERRGTPSDLICRLAVHIG